MVTRQFDPFDLTDEPLPIVGQEARNNTKHRVTEAADVQDVVAIRRLGGTVGL